MESPTRVLAEFTAGLEPSRIPSGVFDSARRCLLDYTGVLLAGSRVATSRTVSEFVRSLSAVEQSSVTGHGYKTCCHLAALANGVSAHILELDDGHLLAHSHPAVTVIPAAIAVAESVKASGSALLTSIIAGYEVLLRLGDTVTPSALYDRGVNVSAVVGSFGAAAAAARVLGLSAQTTRNALGLACLTPVASNESAWTGAGARDLYGGWPSMTGVVAAQLAAAGVSGAPSVLEGQRGICANIANEYDIDRLCSGLGSRWYCTEVYFKQHAACSLIHPAIDAVLALRCSIPDLSRVTRINVETHRFADAFSEPKPSSPAAARFSTPFCVALALKHGHVRHTDFAESNVSDADLLRLAATVSLQRNPDFDRIHSADEARRPCRVTVEIDGHEPVSSYVEEARGTPHNPLSGDELKAKFMDLASPVVGKDVAEELVDLVDNVDALENVEDFTSRLAIVR